MTWQAMSRSGVRIALESCGRFWAEDGNEPSYMFRDRDAQDPFSRAPSYGFRCAVYTSEIPPVSLAPMGQSTRDYSKERPVGDDAFAFFSRMYAYDKIPLEARAESIDDSNESWRKEKVSYRATYNEERIPAYLYLPRNAKPPYQAVLWFPSGQARILRSSDTGLRDEYFNFLLRTGRAVLYPVYKGTFERRPKRVSADQMLFASRRFSLLTMFSGRRNISRAVPIFRVARWRSTG